MMRCLVKRAPFARACEGCGVVPIDPSEVAIRRALGVLGIHIGPVVCGSCFDRMAAEVCAQAFA